MLHNGTDLYLRNDRTNKKDRYILYVTSPGVLYLHRCTWSGRLPDLTVEIYISMYVSGLHW